MKISFVNRPGSVQTGYMLGEPAINRVHPDYDAMQVMNTILGGANGRLFRELRESKGYTYGVYRELAPDWMDVCAMLAGYVAPSEAG